MASSTAENTEQRGSGYEKVLNPMESVFEGSFDDISDLQHDVDDQLNSIFQEFGGDENDTTFKMVIKKVVKGRGELEHCFSCLPSELPVIDRIKKEYGSGSYEIWIYRNGKIFKRPKLNIAQKIGVPAVVNPPHSSIDPSLHLLIQQQNERFASIERALQDRNLTADPMTMMASSVAMVKDIMSVSNHQPSSDPMAMMGGMMGAMLQMKEVMDGFRDDNQRENIGNGDDSFGGIVKSYAPAISEIIKLATIKNGVTPIPNEQSNVPEASQNGDNEHKTPSEDDGNIIKAVSFLAAKAKEGKNPALYAELVIDNFNREQLEEYLKTPDIVSVLAKYYPVIDTYNGWFNELFEEIALSLKEMDAEEEDDTTEEKKRDVGEVNAIQKETANNL